MANILVIDDDKMICDTLADFIGPMGHNVLYALRLKEGLKKVSTGSFDLVFLDVRLPDGNGIEAVPKIRETPSSPEVIIITGEGTPDGAELAIKSGSWDYIQKPLSAETITLPLFRVLQYREEKETGKPPVVLKKEGIVGDSEQIRHCFDRVAKAAATDINVLVTGETGTGKELFARIIHDNSDRSGKSFVVLDCTALPDTLVESMLFGHEKGAFTGADKTREGFVKQADKGTLFLDEVGELPMNIQGAFLRVLQERRFRPLGSELEIKSDFRLIAATNRSLDQMVQAGNFRRDLLFRLRSTVIDLPPLRERTEDIRDLAFYYITKFCDRYGIGTKGFSPEFLEALYAYNWPGNVRELINALERSVSIARNEPTLFPVHLPDHIRARLARASIEQGSQNESNPGESTKISEPFPKLRELVETTEQRYLQDLVSFTEGNIKEVCRISGVSRANIYTRLKKYNISRNF